METMPSRGKGAIRAIAFDAFGTLIRYGASRFNPYRRLLSSEHSERQRLQFLTRNVPAWTFAREMGAEQAMGEFEVELAAELSDLRLYDEATSILQQARNVGLRLAVCSNLAAEYGEAVRRLLPGLDAHILSFEVGAAKPDQAIYAAVCHALSCAPTEVVFVGDSMRCDFDGPKGFGMTARWLDRAQGMTLLDALEGFLAPRV